MKCEISTKLRNRALRAVAAPVLSAPALVAQETVETPDPAAAFRLEGDASAREISQEFRRVLAQYPSTLRS